MPYPSISEKQLVPFVFAVTGHRLLREEDRVVLKARLGSIFEEFRRKMPSTPLVLLSGLAEGADQLAAECALGRQVSLVAVLPMPLPTYQRTMSEDAARHLDHLMRQASAVKVVPAAEGAAADPTTSEDARVECYDRLARFLALNCQVMLALWDAQASDKKGGTVSRQRLSHERIVATLRLRIKTLEDGNRELKGQLEAAYGRLAVAAPKAKSARRLHENDVRPRIPKQKTLDDHR